MSARIAHPSEHQDHQKDFHSRRAVVMVSQRRRLPDYLKAKNFRYEKLISEPTAPLRLGLGSAWAGLETEMTPNSAPNGSPVRLPSSR